MNAPSCVMYQPKGMLSVVKGQAYRYRSLCLEFLIREALWDEVADGPLQWLDEALPCDNGLNSAQLEKILFVFWFH